MNPSISMQVLVNVYISMYIRRLSFSLDPSRRRLSHTYKTLRRPASNHRLLASLNPSGRLSKLRNDFDIRGIFAPSPLADQVRLTPVEAFYVGAGYSKWLHEKEVGNREKIVMLVD